MSPNLPPPRPPGNDEDAIYYQWVWDQLVIYGRLIDTPEIQFDRTTKGIRPKIKIPAARGGGNGIDLADPVEYDPETDYKKKIVVMVSPFNPLVTDGVTNPDDKDHKIYGVPGWYICLKSPVLVRYVEGDVLPDGKEIGDINEVISNLRVPTWPPVGYADDDDVPVDHAPEVNDAVYWFPISFYPAKIENCNNPDDKRYGNVAEKIVDPDPE